MQKLYANLRKDSKYYEGQVQDKPFPVSFDADLDGYHWQGGIGGRYRTTDLHFFVEIGGKLKGINMAYLGQLPQLEVTKNSFLEQVDSDSHSSYWERVAEIAGELQKAAKKEYQKQLKKEELEREEDRSGWGWNSVNQPER